MSNLTNLLLVFALFMLSSLLWHQLFRISPEESMVCSAIIVMLGAFFAGLVGKAWLIYYILGALSIVGLLLFGANFSITGDPPRVLSERIKAFCSPSMVAFTILFLYAVVVFKGAVYTYPDEIAQWGPAVKHMAVTGRLPYGAGFSGTEVTLTTATMFQYIWTGLVPFIERNTLLGNFLLAFIPVYLPFAGTAWRNWKKVFLYTILIFLSFNVLSYVKYYTLLQDYVLPMWTGGIIAWLLWKTTKRINWWILLGSLMCIGSMKSLVGPLFAGAIVLVLLIRQWIYYQPKSIREVIGLKTILLSVLTVSSVLSLSLIWSKLINQNVYNRFIGYGMQKKNVFEIIRGIVNIAFSAASGVPSFPAVSYAVMFVLVIFITFVMRKKFINERENNQFTAVFLLYGAGFVFYLFIMLFAYITVFGQEDSELVAGLDRYLPYYMLMGFIPLCSLAFMDDRLKNHKYLASARCLLFVLLLLGTGYSEDAFISKATTLNLKKDSAYKDRVKIETLNEKIAALTDNSGKIFVLGNMGSTESKLLGWAAGEDRYIWNRDCYKLYIRDIENAQIYRDVIVYPELLKEYDYLWCYQMEEEDCSDLQYRFHMSNMEEGAFYRIVNSGDETKVEYLGEVKNEKEKD